MANLTATISAGTSLSGPVLLGTAKLRGIQIPAGWTPAVLSFTGSIDGTNFFPIFRDGNELTEPVTPGTIAHLKPADFAGATQIQIRSGTVGSPVSQASAASLPLLTE